MTNYEELLTLLNQFSQATDLPIHLFKGHTLCHSFQKNIQYYNLPMYIVSSLPKELPDIWTSNTPEFIYFGGIYMKKFESLLFIGPLFTTTCSLTQARKILNRLGRSQTDANTFRQQFNTLPYCDVPHLKKHLLFLNTLLHRQTATEIPHIDFRWSSFFPSPSPVILSASDSENDSSPFYFSEEKLLAIIRYGKVKELADFFNIQLATASDLPEIENVSLMKNYLIGANTLISRVGKDAGLDYNFVNTLADDYLEQLLHADNTTDLRYLFYQMCLFYTKEIAAILKFECDSPLARKVHSYIHAHLYDKLSTSIIANALNFSESYVCAEFKKATRKTLTAHIQSCKINEAKYLLKQHTMSPSDISCMLGFSSASYFGVVFKKETGMTPGEWAASSLF